MLNDQAHSTSRVHSANVWRSMQFSATLSALTFGSGVGGECARVAPRSPNRDTPAARPQLLPVKGLRAQKVSRPEFVGPGSSHSVSELLHFLSIQRT